VLAGDHLKTASDLGLPLVGVGLLYRYGYFRQTVDVDGQQQHIYPEHDFHRLPVRPAAGATGRDVLVEIPFPGRQVVAKVWVALVGRVPLLLLDTDIPQNDPADRPISGILYVQGRGMRLAQETLLGVGGALALEACGIEPAAWHLNEGHSALLQLERIARQMGDNGGDYRHALDRVRAATVFTTHTPVPAGHEVFDRGLVLPYLEVWRERLGTSADELLRLGQSDERDPGAPLNLTALGLRTAAWVNGVSDKHAAVSRGMWQHFFPGHAAEEVPIHAITNGVHVSTWQGPEIQRLLRQHLGVDWSLKVPREEWGGKLAQVPAAEIWQAHRSQKERLGRFLRSRLRQQFARHGRSPAELRELQEIFNPEALTIGFARRFATYKRASLIFSDHHTLRRLVADRERPLQVIFAGKAHPADRPAQELIQHIFQLSQSDPFRGRVFFIEDYDMRVARMLVQGVDVWLNTPRKPLEASGTSGQKAAINGSLHCSVLDGWWPEAFDGENGWAIGNDHAADDEQQQDVEDAQSLYRLLEEGILPAFFDRDEEGLPCAWAERMRRSIVSVTPLFTSFRMVEDYAREAYLPLTLCPLEP
jgi:starch phosphorylase